MTKIEFTGTVFSGHGKGRDFIKLAWVRSQIRKELGFNPHSGTLNIKLSEDSTKLRMFLVENPVSRINPSNGYYEGLLFKASLSGLECGIIIPEVKDYPNDILEIVAPLDLREKLQLRDGDHVAVTVDV